MIRLSATAGIPAHYINRHCLVTGPTGTGKTQSILRLVESLTSQGVPVFMPDVKGDLFPFATSISSAGAPAWAFGADLLSRALELTDPQSGALEIAFAWADETGAPLDTLQDFRDLLSQMANSPDSVAHLGHVTRASVGVIQRALLRLRDAGAMFRAPGFDITALLDPGASTILDARQLYHSPRLYGAFLLYVLRDLQRRLPECGDLDKPRLVLIFDEAHTLFHEASPALLRSIEATARLIRSKGVGLVFASQSPDDIPELIRAQCATRIEHAREYGVGQAMFATLDATGRPTSPRMIRPDMVTPPPGPVVMPAPDAAPMPPQPDNGSLPLGLALIVASVALVGAGVWALAAGHGLPVAAVMAGAYLASR